MDTTINKETARLLDITRLVSRAGNVLTGVDRVELAYLRRFLSDDVPAFFLVRTAYGYVLLDATGGQAVLDATLGGDWGRADLLSMLRWKLSPTVQASQSLVRHASIARSSRAGLALMLVQNLPEETQFYSVGHTNLRSEFFKALKAVIGLRIHVMIHDTIPMEYPEMQRPSTVQSFQQSLRDVSQKADRVIVISNATHDALVPHLQRFGRLPEMVVAYPGVEPVAPRFSEIPDELDLSAPYFVTVGTIEPRKYHALLLEIWPTIAPEGRPKLLICGRRGWLNQAVFDLLDKGVPDVVEIPNLSDGALSAIVHGAKGLLFPSVAEGFGMPPIEAAILGVPVVCADLPVYRETLGETVIYLDPQDNYSWREAVKELTAKEEADRLPYIIPPTWSSHFGRVLGNRK